MQSYKQVYKTNMNWGGGTHEHPGKRRDPRNFSDENNNFRLSSEKWHPSNNLERKELLRLASEKHNPGRPQYEPIQNEAIGQTKLNKEAIEKTSATTKYADGQPYVKGEAEISQIHKVNDVPCDLIKSGKKAEF